MDKSGSQGKTNRLLSLDALRGVSILIMLLVNHFGPISRRPVQLRHAGWDEGLHVADMAFPWFLLCVGISIPFSVAAFKKKNLPSWKYDLRVVRRVLILLVLGALLNISGDRRFVFFSMGILQIIALAYLTGALLYNLPLHRRLFLAALIIVSYWAVIKFVPVPGVAAGVFEDGRNIIMHINSYYFGNVGLSGITVIVPTTALVLIGTAVGDLMQHEEIGPYKKLVMLLYAGTAMVGVGFLWSLNLQFNKPVWTPSYILFSAGTGTLLLGIFYLLADIYGRRESVYPLIVFGSNAILAYVMPTLMKSLVLRPLGVETAGWSFIIPFIVFWWIVLWCMYRKRVFLRV